MDYHSTKTLGFTEDLMRLIVRGQKTATWRLFDDKNLQVGDIITFVVRALNKEFAIARIDAVREKRLGDISELDYDGHERFSSQAEMLETYRSYYGSRVSNDTKVKIITFTILEMMP